MTISIIFIDCIYASILSCLLMVSWAGGQHPQSHWRDIQYRHRLIWTITRNHVTAWCVFVHRVRVNPKMTQAALNSSAHILEIVSGVTPYQTLDRLSLPLWSTASTSPGMRLVRTFTATALAIRVGGVIITSAWSFFWCTVGGNCSLATPTATITHFGGHQIWQHRFVLLTVAFPGNFPLWQSPWYPFAAQIGALWMNFSK